MHPQIIRDKPGSCPICKMDLVPVEAATSPSSGTEMPVIETDAQALKTLEVQVVRIRKRPVSPGSPDSVLPIPAKALVREGNHVSVVMALGRRRFTSRAVRLGLETPARANVLEGLEDGDVIVTSGQFLLASEIALSRLDRKAAKIRPGGSHE